MKTAISIPDQLFKTVEKAAYKLHMSRSRFYSTAASHYLREIQINDVTERLNAVYGNNCDDSKLPPSILQMQQTALPKDEW
jgi:metal-responsive CopG/Arc/MetJ family transcriptional regulator